MAAPRNVLVFPGGTEIGLEIWSALRDVKDIRLHSAGSESTFVPRTNSIVSTRLEHSAAWTSGNDTREQRA